MRGHAGTGRAEPHEPFDEQDLLGQYLRQIGRTPLLTAQEEVDLAKRIEAGLYAEHLIEQAEAGAAEAPERGDTTGKDLAGAVPEPKASERSDLEELKELVRDGDTAKDHMLRANLRLVVAAAKKYGHRGWPLLDVIQEGNLGLIRAVEKFDYAKGFKFSTYAMWWIRQSIERGLADKSRTVRLPVHILEQLSKVTRAERHLEGHLGHEPTEEEVAAAAGQSVETLAELRRLAHDTVSLDMVVGEDGETRIGDLIADAEVVPVSEVLECRVLAEQLRSLVDMLPDREAYIVTLRYGLGDGRTHTYQEIGDRLGLTRERIRQLERQALRSLRQPEHIEPLLSWAG
ncbi:sigma-70 family RNA polymerase sigma factor [Microtetraspora sp. NBRC 16547]|uniref:sigma-70 family RNA polymerase sigma factor n=1 Tax=Microtetraspora sp. NBRC 16547 TaxID=3030993 RepID=UPI0024A1717B|nr:sigma-70 family RNA polymerase sigma factor [Microtetraspora sp. NBRC 16547]GLW99268.1 RNA polymerase principal sigma factor HrdC [Microtetraspora sp. NBRC 16547]